MRRAGLVLLALWLAAPLVPLALHSVARGWRWPQVLPQDWSLAPWAYALGPVSGVRESLWLTAALAGAAATLALVLALPAGLGLARLRGRARRAVELLVLAPVILPGAALVFGLHAALLPTGLTGSFAGVLVAHLLPALPYAILVVAGQAAGLGPGLEEAARSLGAGPLAAFARVTLPALAPGLAVAFVFAFLISWGQYLLTLVIGGGRVETLPLALFGFATSGRADIAGAIGVIYVLPGLAVLALSGRLARMGAGAALRP